jgi:hypothetical protein
VGHGSAAQHAPKEAVPGPHEREQHRPHARRDEHPHQRAVEQQRHHLLDGVHAVHDVDERPGRAAGLQHLVRAARGLEHAEAVGVLPIEALHAREGDLRVGDHPLEVAHQRVLGERRQRGEALEEARVVTLAQQRLDLAAQVAIVAALGHAVREEALQALAHQRAARGGLEAVEAAGVEEAAHPQPSPAVLDSRPTPGRKRPTRAAKAR